jgi:hypothetical protein
VAAGMRGLSVTREQRRQPDASTGRSLVALRHNRVDAHCATRREIGGGQNAFSQLSRLPAPRTTTAQDKLDRQSYEARSVFTAEK